MGLAAAAEMLDEEHQDLPQDSTAQTNAISSRELLEMTSEERIVKWAAGPEFA
jgi:hypothetical protein